MNYKQSFDVNGVQIEVSLNKAQIEAIESMPEQFRQPIVTAWLKDKAETNSGRIVNRTVFSATHNDCATVVLRGLGNSRPTGLRIDSCETLVANFELFKAAIAAAKAYELANPEKVKAARAARDAKRNAEKKQVTQALKLVQSV